MKLAHRTLRRVILAFATLLLAPLGLTPGGPAEVRAAERATVIVNLAADAIVNYLYRKPNQPPGQGATREQVLDALDREVDQYQGTGVSHLFWNVNYQRVAYRSAV
jgi:hypothetical protein